MICFSKKNVWGVKILELHQMGHENLCAFSEISSAPVCAIINDRSLKFKLEKHLKTFALLQYDESSLTGVDPAQNLTGSNGNPKNFDRRKAARKIFRPAKGVRGHAPPENFENPTSHLG